jgi:hypothetical protein
MCNSLNHPPSCTCGFGGDGHLGRRTYSNSYFGNPVTSKEYKIYAFNDSPYFFKDDYLSFSKNFVNPNAKCPVCGAEVFFCQLENGGRVFFDELGMPWSKHPCTDSSKNRITSNSQAPPELKSVIVIVENTEKTNLNANGVSFIWQKEGWQPFLCLEVTTISRSNKSYVKLDGICEEGSFLLYVRGTEILNLIKQSPILIKAVDKFIFELSTFTENFMAFSDFRFEKNASLTLLSRYPEIMQSHDTSRNSKQLEVNRSSKKTKKPEKEKMKTVMELAFEKARLKNIS